MTPFPRWPDLRWTVARPTRLRHLTPPASEALQRLTDFSPERARNWPRIADNNLIVHDRGEGWAEVTEGKRIAWERERYTWDATALTVSAVTLNSNLWAPGSGWNYTILPAGAGSRIEVTAVRNGYGIKGKLVGLALSLFGKRVVTSSTTAALAAPKRPT